MSPLSAPSLCHNQRKELPGNDPAIIIIITVINDILIRVGTAGVSRRSEALWREALLASRQASLTKFFQQRK